MKKLHTMQRTATHCNTLQHTGMKVLDTMQVIAGKQLTHASERWYAFVRCDASDR